jgi:hypothetical protein
VADNGNAVGFIRDDDRRELDSAIERTVFVRGGLLEQVAYRSNYRADPCRARPIRRFFCSVVR